MTLPLIPSLIALAAAYGFADRFAGGGLPALDARLPGRAAFWGALLAAGVGFLLFGYPGAAFGAVWLAWRTPAWRFIPGSSATPEGFHQIGATFTRHALFVVPGGFIVAKAFALPLWASLGAMTGFAGISTALAAWYGSQARHAAATGWSVSDDNAFVELARGAVFGALVALALGGV